MDVALVAALLELAPELAQQRDLLHRWAQTVATEVHARWPKLTVDAHTFASHLLTKMESPSVEELAQLEAASLFVASACLQPTGSAAIDALERAYAEDLGRVVRGQPEARREELAQELRHKLFLPGSGKLATYSGRGPLGSWLRIVAKRTFLDLERTARRRPDRSVLRRNEGVFERAGDADPELTFLKRHYRGEFRDAFGKAMSTLTPRDRNVLRHHLVDRLSIDEIGRLYEVHRATAGRWIGKARESVLGATRAHMLRTLKIDEEELDSIMRMIDSQLDLTVSRHLREQD